MKKSIIFASLFFWSFGTVAFAADKDRLDDLVDQLNGKACRYEVQDGICVRSKPLNFLLRRNDKERCVLDAARALGLLGAQARSAVPALIEALKKYHNVDSGDGLILVRSEIALALGKIGDPSAIRPLMAILDSDDPVTLSASASVFEGYKLKKGTSYGAVARALGMFGPQAREALPILNALMTKEQNELRVDRAMIEAAIKEISE
jgi:HEAT repeat protein